MVGSQSWLVPTSEACKLSMGSASKRLAIRCEDPGSGISHMRRV